jgi:hypothetical protein
VLIRSWLYTSYPVSWRQDALAAAEGRLACLPDDRPGDTGGPRLLR